MIKVAKTQIRITLVFWMFNLLSVCRCEAGEMCKLVFAVATDRIVAVGTMPYGYSVTYDENQSIEEKTRRSLAFTAWAVLEPQCFKNRPIDGTIYCHDVVILCPNKTSVNCAIFELAKLDDLLLARAMPYEYESSTYWRLNDKALKSTGKISDPIGRKSLETFGFERQLLEFDKKSCTDQVQIFLDKHLILSGRQTYATAFKKYLPEDEEKKTRLEKIKQILSIPLRDMKTHNFKKLSSTRSLVEGDIFISSRLFSSSEKQIVLVNNDDGSWSLADDFVDSSMNISVESDLTIQNRPWYYRGTTYGVPIRTYKIVAVTFAAVVIFSLISSFIFVFVKKHLSNEFRKITFRGLPSD